MQVDINDKLNTCVTVASDKAQITNKPDDMLSSSVKVCGVSGHLIDDQSIIWYGYKGEGEVRLYYSKGEEIKLNNRGVLGFPFFQVKPKSLSESQRRKYPHLKYSLSYAIPENIDLALFLKGELALVAVDELGEIQAATLVQTAGALDALYADDATELEYGAIVKDHGVTFRIWAPTAQKVSLLLFDQEKKQQSIKEMQLDPKSGSWSYQSFNNLVGKYYRFEIKVYHPETRRIEQYQVTDPYSLSLAMNSTHSQVIDLNDPRLKPSGWDQLKAPHLQINPADISIYEAHIRDLTAHDNSTPAQFRGKFLGLTVKDSVPVKHLKSLAKSGVTHLHLLPIFDFGSVNEDPTQVVDINDSFIRLSQIKPEIKKLYPKICDSNKTIGEVLLELSSSDSMETPKVQALYHYLRELDSFNWGYDPYHYATPEGSYATQPDGSARILEFRKMVMAIKQMIGMNLAMDMVYNHTYASGVADPHSVLDKIVPSYYHRLNLTTGEVENSTCCSNTAPEHAMFAKLMKDSLITWSRDYKIDAYRFDLMGHHPKAQILDSLAAVQSVDPNTYFYGEGWNFGEVANDSYFVQATQANLAGTGIGTFSDRLRDAVRGGTSMDSGKEIRNQQGYGNGAYILPNETNSISKRKAQHLADLVRLGMAGNLKSFTLTDNEGRLCRGDELNYSGQAAGYANDPFEVQNYVSKHDNQSLFDNNAYKAREGADLVKMQQISLATVLLGQGIPFTHAGSELLRSKSMERDSYNSGDWYNNVDYSLNDNNFNKGLPRADQDAKNYNVIEQVIKIHKKPTSDNMKEMSAVYRELVELRYSTPLLHLPTGDEIIKRVDFLNTGSGQKMGLIVMTVDDGTKAGLDLDPNLDAIVVMINANNKSQSLRKSLFNDLLISPAHHQKGISSGVKKEGKRITLAPWSAVVLVKPQHDKQGKGIPRMTPKRS